MHSVKIKREELLTIVQANRAKHREVFLEAMTNYRTAAIAELERSIADAKAGKKITRTIRLVEPMDQTEQYDQVIQMLGLSVEDVVELDSTEFAQYVRDNWHWRKQFATANSAYLISGSAKQYIGETDNE